MAGHRASIGDRDDPDVAEADDLAVILKPQREGCGVGPIRTAAGWIGGAEDKGTLLNAHAVEVHGDAGGPNQTAVLGENRSDKLDGVALPFAGRAGRIGAWGMLAINSPGLAVGVGDILIRVEDLNLILANEEDAAVAAILAAFQVGAWRCPPLEMKPAGAEGRASDEVVFPRPDFEVIARENPVRGQPGGEVLSFEEDDGTGGRSGDDLGGGQGSYDGRLGSGAIIEGPAKNGGRLFVKGRGPRRKIRVHRLGLSRGA